MNLLSDSSQYAADSPDPQRMMEDRERGEVCSSDIDHPKDSRQDHSSDVKNDFERDSRIDNETNRYQDEETIHQWMCQADPRLLFDTRRTSKHLPQMMTRNQRGRDTAEEEVLHMTQLLSQRRESEARRHLLLAEMEVGMEREHRIRVAASALAAAAMGSLTPCMEGTTTITTSSSRNNNHNKSSCPIHHHQHHQHPHSHHHHHHQHHQQRQQNRRRRTAVHSGCCAEPREVELLISIKKTEAGLGFSLTTKMIHLPQTATHPVTDQVPDSSHSKTTEEDLKSVGRELHSVVCVKHLLPGGAALNDGHLCLGDRLLQIDDEDVVGKSQAQIVSILRVKSVNSIVRLLVGRSLSDSMTNRQAPACPCPSCLSRPSGVTQLLLASEESRASVAIDSPLAHAADCSPSYCTLAGYLSSTSPGPTGGSLIGRSARCASPVLPVRRGDLEDGSVEYPSYSDVLLLRLEVPLHSEKVELLETIATSTSTNGSTSTGTVTRHMRLGISVRETSSSRTTKLFERSLKQDDGQRGPFDTRFPPNSSTSLRWEDLQSADLGSDSIYGGVVVKGIIEGSAAFKNGILQVGDELLEVNGIQLTKTPSPLNLLRSVLKRLTLAPTTDQTNPPPAVVKLLVARRKLLRRSASGHTLASNSEFWMSESQHNNATLSQMPEQNLEAQVANNTTPIIIHQSNRAVKIAADVHSVGPDESTPTSATFESHDTTAEQFEPSTSQRDNTVTQPQPPTPPNRLNPAQNVVGPSTSRGR